MRGRQNEGDIGVVAGVLDKRLLNVFCQAFFAMERVRQN